MGNIKEKSKAFAKNIESWARQTIKDGKPLGQISYHNKPNPQQDLPNIVIMVHEPTIRTVKKRKGEKDRIDFVPRVVQNRGMKAEDSLTVLRFLIRNYRVTPTAFKEAMEQETLWQQKQEEIAKQHQIEEQQRIEKRKRNFSEIKMLWTYNHMPDYVDKVTELIRSLSPQRKAELKKQIRNNQYPSRWTPTHRRDILLLIEALENKN